MANISRGSALFFIICSTGIAKTKGDDLAELLAACKRFPSGLRHEITRIMSATMSSLNCWPYAILAFHEIASGLRARGWSFEK